MRGKELEDLGLNNCIKHGISLTLASLSSSSGLSGCDAMLTSRFHMVLSRNGGTDGVSGMKKPSKEMLHYAAGSGLRHPAS